MPLIEWTRLPGEAVETTVAMLLCGVNFEATQMRPGRGDGGIDVFVPTGTGASGLSSRDIYQVKRYAENLTSSQKRKIKRSLDQVVDTAENEGWTITSWYLVLPLNPTPANTAWFDEITTALPFKCRWVGLNRIEKLASGQPQVIDYYLRDGRERLAAQTDRLAGVLAGRDAREHHGELTPRHFIGDLHDIYDAMNQYDPYYRYEISMTAEPPSNDADHRKPGLVAIASSGRADGWVNVSIFARSLAAMKERPITGKFEVRLGEDIDPGMRSAYEKFINFGTPVSLPPGTASAILDLPGGLGVEEATSGSVSLGPAVTDVEGISNDRELIFATLDPDNRPLAEVKLYLMESTIGPLGGRRTVWTDRPNFLTLELLAINRPDITVNITVSADAAGRRPSEFVDTLEVLATMHEPNHLAFAESFGPRRFSVASNSELREKDMDFVRMAQLARALTTIQQHTPRKLLYPELVSGDQALQILDAAKLVSGKSLKGTFHGCKFVRDHSSESSGMAYVPGDTVELRLIRDVEIELDGKIYMVAKEMAMMMGVVTEFSDHAAAFAPAPDSSEVIRVRFDGDIAHGRLFSRHIE